MSNASLFIRDVFLFLCLFKASEILHTYNAKELF